MFRLDGAAATVSVEDTPLGRSQSDLRQNFPNPFKSATIISYTATKWESVRLEIFDAAGRLVRVLVDGMAPRSGTHEVVWDGLNSHGDQVAAGVYFYRLVVEDRIETKRMVITK